MEVNVGVLFFVLFLMSVVLCVVCVCLGWVLLLRLDFPQGGGCMRQSGLLILSRLNLRLAEDLGIHRVSITSWV